MKIVNLKRSLAKRLGTVAVAGGMSLGLASDGYAVPVTIPDSGFEDHVVDDPTGYAYGAAGQVGDPDGFNNPSSANGGVSPWQALATYGNGIDGDNASWIQNSGYQLPNTGDQSAEVQGLFAQNLTTAFVAGKDYIATVAANADGGDANVVMSLYDADAVTFLPTSTPTLILDEPSLVTATPVVTSSGYSDETFQFSFSDLTHLVGKNIGIAIYAPDVTGQGPRIDDIRLDTSTPFKLTVNRTTGDITMGGPLDEPVDIDFYEITSAGNSLDTGGWNSFSDQNLDPVDDGLDPGETWDEAGGSDAGLLREAFLLGSSVFNSDDTQTLGAGYDTTTDAQDLVFRYGKDGASSLAVGLVEYVTSLLGDMNDDGSVNNLDVNPFVQALTDRAAFDAAHPTVDADAIGDMDGDGSLNFGDVALFKAAAAPGTASGQGVPEPTSLLLLTCGIVALTLRRR